MNAVMDLNVLCNGLVPAVDKASQAAFLAGLGNKFRFWHVEPLLNQAADLLDRCVTEYQQLQLLDSRRAELGFMVAEAEAADIMQQARVASDWYELESKIIDNSDPHFSSTCKSLGRVVTAYSTWLKGAPDDGQRQAFVNQAQSAVDRATMESSERTTQHDATSAESLRQTTYISAIRDVIADREKATKDGNALDFNRQIDSLSERIQADFAQAYQRAYIAALGARDIFGYAIAVPARSDNFDDIFRLLFWTRNAISSLVAFAQYDQVFSFPISVKALLGNEWADVITSLKRNGVATDIQFFIDVSALPSFRYIRVKGIAAFSRGASDLLSVRVRVPSSAISIHVDANGTDTPTYPFQEAFPACLIGRVEGRESPRAPEIAGTAALLNASPFGKKEDKDNAAGRWHLDIALPMGGKLSKLDDIELELVVAAQPSVQNK